MKNGELELTIVERGSSGNVLSTETLTLYHCNTALESQQILNETRQIYRWSDKDRLILGIFGSTIHNKYIILNQQLLKGKSIQFFIKIRAYR